MIFCSVGRRLKVNIKFGNRKPTLLVHCLYQMLPLNHKKTTSSLAPPIICVAKKIGNKRIEGSSLHLPSLQLPINSWITRFKEIQWVKKSNDALYWRHHKYRCLYLNLRVCSRWADIDCAKARQISDRLFILWRCPIKSYKKNICL